MWPLVERIVRHSSGISPHVPAALVMAANCPDWVNLDNVDIPIICQRTLSVTIDEAIYSHLLFNAPDTHSRTRGLGFSSSIAHTGDWLNVVPLAPIMIMMQKFCYVRNNRAKLVGDGTHCNELSQKYNLPLSSAHLCYIPIPFTCL